MKNFKFFLLAFVHLVFWANSAQAHYDPNMGRWLNRDPIAKKGGVNLYGFVGTEKTDAEYEAASAIVDAEAELDRAFFIHEQAQQNGHPYALTRGAGVWTPANGDENWRQMAKSTIDGIKLACLKAVNEFVK